MHLFHYVRPEYANQTAVSSGPVFGNTQSQTSQRTSTPVPPSFAFPTIPPASPASQPTYFSSPSNFYQPTFHSQPAFGLNASNVANVGRSSTVPLQALPKYDGSRKGLAAKSWIRDLEQIRILYNMSESQMIPAARFSCTDQAREWAEIQPDNQTWAQFRTAFL
jgi:hypothetical protein